MSEAPATPQANAPVKSIHVPRMRWGGRWADTLNNIPKDGDWHFVARYGRTSGYQIARSLNIARHICSLEWEFGARQLDTASELHVRWAPRRV